MLIIPNPALSQATVSFPGLSGTEPVVAIELVSPTGKTVFATELKDVTAENYFTLYLDNIGILAGAYRLVARFSDRTQNAGLIKL